jgi:two-component sensor histidine kinase
MARSAPAPELTAPGQGPAGSRRSRRRLMLRRRETRVHRMLSLDQERAHLAKAEQDIAAGQMPITAQELQIQRMRLRGHDTRRAEELLDRLRQTLVQWHAHRAETDEASPAVAIEGPEVRLKARQVQNFALAVHELTTNAVKYGALKDGSGRLSITWDHAHDESTGRRLALRWIESGVAIPQSAAPRRGYGTELIQEALAYALQVEVEYVLEPGGVRCRIEMPVS